MYASREHGSKRVFCDMPSIDEIKNIFFSKSASAAAAQKKRRLSYSIPQNLHDEKFYLHEFEIKPKSTSITSSDVSFFPKEEDETDEYEFYCTNMTEDLKKIATRRPDEAAQSKLLANDAGDFYTVLHNIRNIKTLNSAQKYYISNEATAKELNEIILAYDEMYDAIVDYISGCLGTKGASSPRTPRSTKDIKNIQSSVDNNSGYDNPVHTA